MLAVWGYPPTLFGAVRVVASPVCFASHGCRVARARIDMRLLCLSFGPCGWQGARRRRPALVMAVYFMRMVLRQGVKPLRGASLQVPA